MKPCLHIYFHRDFDGIVAAALLSSLLESIGKYDCFEYLPVDYEIKDRWNHQPLRQPAAVLDFLYHSDAEIYFDHHSTTFINEEARGSYSESDWRFWDKTFKSTPSLLRSKLGKFSNIAKYDELISWADKIDSAQYSSPSEVYDYSNKYLALNRLIGYYQDDTPEIRTILAALNSDKIDQYISSKSEVISKIKSDEAYTLKQVGERAIFDSGICFIDQSDLNVPFQRYASYLLFPQADFTVAVFRRGGDYQVSLGYNPWMNSNSLDLGKLAEQFGGGGRVNVAGIIKQSREDAIQTADKIVELLHSSIYTD